MFQIFPPLTKYELETKNPQIQIYGHRIYKDQTLYEYLLEFLLVFISRKGTSNRYEECENTEYTLKVELSGDKMYYYPVPRIALKRFIFLNRSEQDKRFEVDKQALKEHHELLFRKLDISQAGFNKEFAVNVLQDLFYGFNAIIGKRSWFAQSLLPLAPEIIFCESIGNKDERTKLDYKNANLKLDIDNAFKFDQHSFMARGGEVYYLHIVQGLSQLEESYRNDLEVELKKLVTNIPQLSKLANFIQKSWEETEPEDDFIEKSANKAKKSIEVIPADYGECAKDSVTELHHLLKSELDPFEKIALVGTLIPIQILRMMNLRAIKVSNLPKKQEWLIDLTKDTKGQIRKKAVQVYEKFEENIYTAIHKANIDRYESKLQGKDRTSILVDAAKDTNLLVRKLGKEIGLIIPVKGPNMRFSLNETLVKVLVLSLIKPGERILFTTFLERCYKHFNMVIGPKEASQHYEEEISYLISFNENEQEFLGLLKNCGFLRNLSDATSIVENPFKG